MANTVVQLHTLPSLGTLTLRIYPRSGGAIENGAGGDSMAEHGVVLGLYQATVTEALTGIHAARVYSGSDLIGSYLIDLRDDTGAYDLADPAIAVGANTLAAQEIAAEVEIEASEGGGEVTSFSNAALQQLAGVTIRLSQPFRGPRVPLEIVQGDDYSDTDGRAIDVTITGLDEDIVYTGAAAHLTLKLGELSVTFTATGITEAGDDVVIRFEPAAAQTAELTTIGDDWQYDVQITLAGGRKITPIAEAPARVLASFSD